MMLGTNALGATPLGDGTGATRPVAPRTGVDAALRYAGLPGAGGLAGETRLVTGCTVTNSGPEPLGIEIEDEATKVSWTAVIPPGETREVTAVAVTLTQYWNTATPIGGAGPRWDGLTLRFREPA